MHLIELSSMAKHSRFPYFVSFVRAQVHSESVHVHFYSVPNVICFCFDPILCYFLVYDPVFMSLPNQKHFSFNTCERNRTIQMFFSQHKQVNVINEIKSKRKHIKFYLFRSFSGYFVCCNIVFNYISK